MPRGQIYFSPLVGHPPVPENRRGQRYHSPLVGIAPVWNESASGQRRREQDASRGHHPPEIFSRLSGQRKP
jgi:hypothetical protein